MTIDEEVRKGAQVCLKMMIFLLDFVLDEFYVFVYFVSLFWGSCSFKPPFPTRINFGTIADLFIVRFLLRF